MMLENSEESCKGLLKDSGVLEVLLRWNSKSVNATDCHPVESILKDSEVSCEEFLKDPAVVEVLLRSASKGVSAA